MGRPLVVSDVGWFSELPDRVAAKVPVDAWEIDMLTAVLARLAGDGEVNAEMSHWAFEYVERESALEQVAELYCAALEEGVGRSLVLDTVVAQVAEAVVDVGLAESDRELREVAGALREVGLGD
jgi:hypothetical protein